MPALIVGVCERCRAGVLESRARAEDSLRIRFRPLSNLLESCSQDCTRVTPENTLMNSLEVLINYVSTSDATSVPILSVQCFECSLKITPCFKGPLSTLFWGTSYLSGFVLLSVLVALCLLLSIFIFVPWDPLFCAFSPVWSLGTFQALLPLSSTCSVISFCVLPTHHTVEGGGGGLSCG